MWIKKNPIFHKHKECSLLNKRMNTCESPLAIYLHMLDEIHDGMEVYEDNLPLHIQQGKYSICIDERNEKLYNNTWLQGYKDKCPHNNPTLPLIKRTGAIQLEMNHQLNGNCRV